MQSETSDTCFVTPYILVIILITILAGVLLPDSPINKTSCSWSCHCVQYQDSSSNQENGDSFSILPNSSQHKVEYKAVKEVIDKFKRLVSQTDRTDIKANLKLLGAWVIH